MASDNPPVDLELTAGLPYRRRFRITNGTQLWPSKELYEIRSDIRAGRTSATPLLGRLSPYITSSIEGADIVVDLVLAGKDTRVLPKGYYDIIISDPGGDDVRAISICSGKIKISYLRTAPVDE